MSAQAAQEPAGLAARLWPGVAVLGAALVGLGVILWLAANWDDLGRMGRFALLQGAVAAASLGAAWSPRARSPLALGALLGIGGLFAYFGQTYQTGADPWQLFALWALLALPLVLGARSDVLWAPWALVVMVAISLWTHAHAGHRWQVRPDLLGIYFVAWAAAALLVASLSPVAARLTGAGIWSLRTAGTLTVMMVTLTALGGLFSSRVAAHYPLALALFALGAAVLTQRRFFELFLLSAVTLGLNTLLVAGLGRWLFTDSRGDSIGRLLVLGLFAAALLATSVSLITRTARRHAEGVSHG